MTEIRSPDEMDRIAKQCVGDVLPICPKLCMASCDFLKSCCQTPKELAQALRNGQLTQDPGLVYSCNLCGLCKRLCIRGLDVGRMCLELRRQMVEEGTAPLPSHGQIIEDQTWISGNFALSMPNPATGECNRVFFPGCSLSGNSPSLVVKTYDYLREKLPDTGIMLNCCGGPVHLIGDEAGFKRRMAELQSELDRLGASEIIVACPECYHTLKDVGGLPVVSIYEIMATHGLPVAAPSGEGTFSLHDSCSTRYEEGIQDSVRSLVTQMGYQIEELTYSRSMTRCCGMGGMASYANPKLTNKVTMRRAREAKRDMLSYCASCRDAFAFVGKPSVHVLDLIFNPDWQKSKRAAPTSPKAKKENQGSLKSQFESQQKEASNV